MEQEQPLEVSISDLTCLLIHYTQKRKREPVLPADEALSYDALRRALSTVAGKNDIPKKTGTKQSGSRYSIEDSIAILAAYKKEILMSTYPRNEKNVQWMDINAAIDFVRACTSEELETVTNDVRIALRRDIRRKD